MRRGHRCAGAVLVAARNRGPDAFSWSDEVDIRAVVAEVRERIVGVVASPRVAERSAATARHPVAPPRAGEGRGDPGTRHRKNPLTAAASS